MAITDTAPAAVRGAARAKSKPAYRFSMLYFATAVGAIALIYAAYRVYFDIFAFTAGLDATSPEFQAYWNTLLIIELPVLFGAGFLCWGYLIATRDRNMAAMTPEVEFKRLYHLTLWLVAYTAAVFPLGYWTEADASWHQTVMRDTAFSPTHIIIFYAGIPIYLFFGVGAFIYGMTRCPVFTRGISFMFVLAVVGPFLILPNVGFNEWGHAFWLTEEIFSHPLHWGFVVLGVTALALGGVAIQIAIRLRELFPVVFKLKQAGATG